MQGIPQEAATSCMCTVGILRIGASSDKGQGGRACPHVLRPRFPPLGLGQLRGHHVPPQLRLLPLGTATGPRACQLGFSTHLLTQDSSGAVTCPEDGLCRLQVIKQISSGDPAIMIYIGARAHLSSKALRDKGCSAHSQGMQQTAH
jgi:hypothetical protein